MYKLTSKSAIKVLQELKFPSEGYIGDATAAALRDAFEKTDGVLVTLADEYKGPLSTLNIGEMVIVNRGNQSCLT